MFADSILELNAGETHPIFSYKGHVFSFGETMVVSCESKYVLNNYSPNSEYETKIENLVGEIRRNTKEKREKEIEVDELCHALKDITSYNMCFVERKCDSCHGDKMVKYTFTASDGKTYEHEDICPVCNGTGIIDDEKIIRKISIGGKVYNMTDIIETLALALEMQVSKFTIVSMEGSGYAVVQYGHTVASIIPEWEDGTENELTQIIKLDLSIDLP